MSDKYIVPVTEKVIDSKIPEGPVAEKWTNSRLIRSSLTRKTNVSSMLSS